MSKITFSLAGAFSLAFKEHTLYGNNLLGFRVLILKTQSFVRSRATYILHVHMAHQNAPIYEPECTGRFQNRNVQAMLLEFLQIFHTHRSGVRRSRVTYVLSVLRHTKIQLYTRVIWFQNTGIIGTKLFSFHIHHE